MMLKALSFRVDYETAEPSNQQVETSAYFIYFCEEERKKEKGWLVSSINQWVIPTVDARP